MIDAVSLFNALLDWQVNPKLPFHEGKVLRVGNSSVVIQPHQNPSVVIKIVLTGRKVHGVRPAQEARFLEKYRTLDTDLFAVPKLISYGADPDHIVMSYLGAPCGKGIFAGEGVDPAKVGKAFGAFAAELWLKDRLIHDDLCFGNATLMPDGRIGIVDFASIRADRPEAMFLPNPLCCVPGVARVMAETFEERSGVRLDLDWMRERKDNMILMLEMQREQDPGCDLADRCEENWNDFLRMNQSNRPCRKTPNGVLAAPTKL